MDKNAIKKYAVWARTELITRVSQRAEKYDITAEADVNVSSVNGVLLSDAEKKQRKALIEQVQQKGFDQVMEEVAYTWFNRFIALRFMEVNGYLPSHIRVFTDDNNNFKPQILAEAIHLELDGLDMEKVYEMKNNNENEDLYKYLIITQCNDLSKVLPGIFQKISDFTELLFPDNVLREGSVIEQMVYQIEEKDWDISEGGQIEILGWLYQYYISEPKDVLINARKQYGKKDIPYVTQLFTPDWIVKYMVENTIGRYWKHNGYKTSDKWHYYLESKSDLENEVNSYDSKIEAFKCIDPCAGSGHILVYMFDILMEIYEHFGFSAHEAARSIVNHNLFGIDIDKRAAQIAYFSIMMKARQYDRRFFSSGIQPNIMAIEESNNISTQCLDYFCNGDVNIRKNIDIVVNSLRDGKIYGSLLSIPSIDFECLNKRIQDISGDISLLRQETMDSLSLVIKCAELLFNKYDTVITNPPYMNFSYMPGQLKTYIQDQYADFKGDLFSAFFKRAIDMCKEDGEIGLLMPSVWMSISTYESMRQWLGNNALITSLVQLEYNAFEAACVPVAALTLKKTHDFERNGEYVRLSEFKGVDNQEPKYLEAVRDEKCGYRYSISQENFKKIPGTPIAYWMSKNTLECFGKKYLGDVATFCKGMDTGDNDKFIRLWFEVDKNKLNTKWFFYNKGGEFRKWYGNFNYVINWENDGEEVINFPKSNIRNKKTYFTEGYTWSLLSPNNFGMRYLPNGSIYDGNGCMMFPPENGKYICGFMNSNVFLYLAKFMHSNMAWVIGDLKRIPFILTSDLTIKGEVERIVEENIDTYKKDWDYSEASWDFKRNPLIPQSYGLNVTIEKQYEEWKEYCNKQREKVKNNQIRLNSIFKDIYNLKNEISEEYSDEDITISVANVEEDIKKLLSYAVGCMFGRYSLKEEGIICTDGNLDMSRYDYFYPDADNIIPICDDEYFNDDIVGRIVEFIKVVYGEKTLEQNLQFIADAIGGNGTSRDIIRDYFINSYYIDHCSLFSVIGSGKRPIYWLFDSGKKNGFKCLMYLHRYQQDTVARIRTDYIHEQQSRYHTAIEEIGNRLLTANATDKVKLNRKLKHLKEQDIELHSYEELIHHLADQMISIDIDDGVKSNYAIFQNVLSKIK